MLAKLYRLRFEIFLLSQVTVLFGLLIFPTLLFETALSPMLFIVNLGAGVLLISKSKKLMWFCILLLIISIVIFVYNLQTTVNNKSFDFLRMGTFFMFYSVISYEIIKQVWRATTVSKNVILGLISGYISLGLIGFFIFLSIEMANTGSFNGISSSFGQLTDHLMYFSYITILTIGYGDITPATTLAQKATILLGLTGQFYMVIVTATIVGKYISQLSYSDKNK